MNSKYRRFRDMKTVYYTATSIDGYIADPQNSLDWLFQFGEVEGMEDEFPRFMSRIGAAVMGSTTYEWVVEHDNLMVHPDKWSFDVPTWVFSTRRLPAVEGADIRFVSGDVAPVHEQMARAAGEKDIWLVGGGELVGQFHDEGLLDEIIVTLAPVTLGAGAPLLPRKITTPPFRLLHVEQLGDVFAKLTYEVRPGT